MLRVFFQLREQLPSFDLGFMEHDEFREFYRFCFQFSREGTHRTIERDVAVPLLQIVSHSQFVWSPIYIHGVGTPRCTAAAHGYLFPETKTAGDIADGMTARLLKLAELEGGNF